MVAMVRIVQRLVIVLTHVIVIQKLAIAFQQTNTPYLTLLKSVSCVERIIPFQESTALGQGS